MGLAERGSLGGIGSREEKGVRRAVVNPPQFFGTSINEKTVYSVQPYASPDACSSQGQKINPWTVSWNWSALDPRVATVTSFNTKVKMGEIAGEKQSLDLNFK
jgi:hypothetical protein